ncbi:MAG: 30S ribosomal protein S3 [Candidatus Woesearchaeota archaeon]
MIERKFIAEKLKEHQIQEFVSQTLKNVGHSHTKLMKTPLGEKVIIYASRPGLVVGRKGENIKKLTNTLKKKFNLENPQIEISEVENPNLDSQIVAERIASTIERFGINKFKAIGHKTMMDVMGAGALGIEILISGKVPSQRAKTWRFYSGYLKKCGNISTEGVKRAQAVAIMKTGEIGIQVAIMTPDVKLPDDIEVGKKEEAPKAETPKEEKKAKKTEKTEETE